MRRVLVVGLSCGLILLALALTARAAEEPPKGEKPTSEDLFMELGTREGVLGGERQKAFELTQLKEQIKTFIPPLLRPAFTQHAFVLPPGAVAVSVSDRYTEIDGEDFFKNGDSNLAVFKDFEVNRHFTDFDFFVGLDLNHQFLHGFTVRVNVPVLDSRTDGFIHPNGQQFISIENAGSSTEIGDVGVFLKKKVLDQGASPFGLAVVGAVFLPSGTNNAKFGSNGRVTTKRPQPPTTTVAQGFDALMAANVANGTWGDTRCFFRNFNLANRALCNNMAPFGAPGAAVQSFAPGGANFENAFVGDFPFNGGIFGRFSDDGRLPTVLQPGTGEFGYLAGVFLTRQFAAGDVPGRSAVHLGAAHRFVQEEDGIDPGDTTTLFVSVVKPVYKDFLAVDGTFVAKYHEDDSYSGKIPEPEIHTCNATDVSVGIMGCGAVGDQAFVFELVDRPSFSGGWTGLIAPSLIISPDPQIRVTITALFRVIEPDLGPAPPWVARAGVEFIY